METMKKIEHHSGMFETDSACIRRLLDEWKPRSFTLSEKEQEIDLQNWLQKCLPDVPIVPQYGIAKGKADLVVQDCHVIELKLAFFDENLVEFDRCMGQMERYRQKWVNMDRGDVFLVIVGKSETEFRGMLHKAIEQLNRGYFHEWFYLVEKLG